MNHIIEYIKQKYDPCSIILYGSYADGTNNLNSDFDALVLSYDHKQFHDTSFVNGVQLDLFVYPVSYFDEAYNCNDFIQIFDGRIIMDSNDRGKALQAKVLSYLQEQLQKPREEIAAGVDWCGKMLARARRNDAEGLFRWHWVLTDSLEIYCDIMQHPYFGPKKALKWMEKVHPSAFSLYEKALGEFNAESLENWIAYIKNLSNKV